MKIHIDVDNATSAQVLRIKKILNKHLKLKLNGDCIIEDSSVFDGDLIIWPNNDNDSPKHINQSGNIVL